MILKMMILSPMKNFSSGVSGINGPFSGPHISRKNALYCCLFHVPQSDSTAYMSLAIKGKGFPWPRDSRRDRG